MNWLGRVGLRLRLEGLIRKNSELYKLEIPSAGGGPVGCGGFGAAEPQVPDRGTRPLLSEHEFAARGGCEFVRVQRPLCPVEPIRNFVGEAYHRG